MDDLSSLFFDDAIPWVTDDENVLIGSETVFPDLDRLFNDADGSYNISTFPENDLFRPDESDLTLPHTFHQSSLVERHNFIVGQPPDWASAQCEDSGFNSADTNALVSNNWPEAEGNFLDIDKFIGDFGTPTDATGAGPYFTESKDDDSDCSVAETSQDVAAIDQIRKLISQLREQNDCITMITTALDSKMRRKTHEAAEMLGLVHRGIGSGRNMPILLSKCQFAGTAHSRSSGSHAYWSPGLVDSRILCLWKGPAGGKSPSFSQKVDTGNTPQNRTIGMGSAVVYPEDASNSIAGPLSPESNRIYKASYLSTGEVDLVQVINLLGSCPTPNPFASEGEIDITPTDRQRSRFANAYLKWIIESAILRATELGNLSLAAALQDILKQCMDDCNLRNILEAVLNGDATEHDITQFNHHIRAAKAKRRRKTLGPTSRSRKTKASRTESLNLDEIEDLCKILKDTGSVRPERLMQDEKRPYEVYAYFLRSTDALMALGALRGKLGSMEATETSLQVELLHFKDENTLLSFTTRWDIPPNEDPETGSSLTSLQNSTPHSTASVWDRVRDTLDFNADPMTTHRGALAQSDEAESNPAKRMRNDDWKCPFPGCDETFSTSGQYRQHKKIHQVRPHVCQPCDKAFLYAKDLRRHQNSMHSGDGAK